MRRSSGSGPESRIPVACAMLARTSRPSCTAARRQSGGGPLHLLGHVAVDQVVTVNRGGAGCLSAADGEHGDIDPMTP